MITMNNREKININLDPIRVNPQGKFIIRFSDTNEQTKNLLTTRIKETATQRSIRMATDHGGPTLEQIYQALKSINPIIFAENISNTYISSNASQNFGIFRTYTLTSYYYTKLCQAIYQIVCIKRPLKKTEMQRIAFLTCGNNRLADTYVRNNFIEQVNENNNQELTTIPEMGLEDMERIRHTAEINGAGNIPRGMLNYEPEEEEIVREPSTPDEDLSLLEEDEASN